MIRFKIENECSRTYKYIRESGQAFNIKIIDPIYEWHQGGVIHIQSDNGEVAYIPAGWVCFVWEPIDEEDPFEGGSLGFL